MRWPEFFVVVLALPCLIAAKPQPTDQGVENAAVPGPVNINQPWTTAAGANGDTALYMTLVNEGSVRDDLVRADCGVATSMQIDAPGASDADTSGAGFHQVAGIPLFPGRTMVMGPHGYRILLHGLRREIVPRDLLPCTVFLQRSGERLIEVSVLPAESNGPVTLP